MNSHVTCLNYRVKVWTSVVTLSLLFTSYSLADISQCRSVNDCSWRPIIPVCGSDGKLYYNECHLKYKKCMIPNLRVVNYDHCKHEHCPRPCTRELDEVCGSDGELSSNPCTFLEHVCDVKWTKIYEIDLNICINKKCGRHCKPNDKKCLREEKNCRFLYGGGLD